MCCQDGVKSVLCGLGGGNQEHTSLNAGLGTAGGAATNVGFGTRSFKAAQHFSQLFGLWHAVLYAGFVGIKLQIIERK